ncbi:hypothetical protein AX15_002760 [Amanita polypyramis BW_CC]|nr:hypothetical protein AX15_002760 [Amanita polypyramis BW_CC]
MAIHPSLLTSAGPATVVPASPHIIHVQLRDLILCPREPGLVTYVHEKGIVEQDIHAPPGTPPRIITEPKFHPNTLAALPIPDTNDILYAAGGQEADLHFSYHTIYNSSSPSNNSSSPSLPTPRRKRFRPASTSKLIWQFSDRLKDCSINNSVVLTNSLGLSYSSESAIEPRVIVSNNDNTVKFFDVPLRTTGSKNVRNLKEAGLLRLNVPVNHTSLSPDSRTVLSVGDSSDVYLHHVSGGARLTFTPISSLTLPKPEGLPFWLPTNALTASFSSAFSADGVKFAVASQEGVVAVWDVRSTKPMKVFQTDKRTGLGPGSPGRGGLWASGAAAAGWNNSAASGWLFEDAHFHGAGAGTVRAPSWSIRNVKFGGGVAGSGKEVIVFTEHANLLHIVDAKTFETEQIVHVPAAKEPAMAPTPLTRPTRPSSARTASENSLTSGTRSGLSSSPSVDYVYSQLPGFARRGSRLAGPAQRDRELRDIQERRLQRSRETLARRMEREDEGVNGTQPRTRTGYSPPSSIGDSTWRTLRTAGEDRGAGRGRGGLRQLSRLLRPEGSDRQDREEEEAVLSLIPALVEGIEVRDVEEILNRHGFLGGDYERVRGRDRGIGEENTERDEDADEEDDPNTGSTVADFEYEFGESSIWRNAGGRREDEMDLDGQEPSTSPSSRGVGGGRGFNWITGREEEDVDEQHEDEERGREREAVAVEGDGTTTAVATAGTTTTGSSDLDLAGVCFDPTGSRVYVASTASIVEWHVRGADKRWWSDDGWA